MFIPRAGLGWQLAHKTGLFAAAEKFVPCFKSCFERISSNAFTVADP